MLSVRRTPMLALLIGAALLPWPSSSAQELAGDDPTAEAVTVDETADIAADLWIANEPLWFPQNGQWWPVFSGNVREWTANAFQPHSNLLWARTTAAGNIEGYAGQESAGAWVEGEGDTAAYVIQDPLRNDIWMLHGNDQHVTVPWGSTILFPAAVATNETKGYLGLDVIPLEPALAKHLSLTSEEALLIASVAADSPAARHGLEQYDVVVAIDGESPATAERLRQKLEGHELGSTPTVSLSIRRGTQQIEVLVPIEVRSVAADAVTSYWFPATQSPHGFQQQWLSPSQGFWSPITAGEYPRQQLWWNQAIPASGEGVEGATSTDSAEPDRLATIESRLDELEATLEEGLAKILAKLGEQ